MDDTPDEQENVFVLRFSKWGIRLLAVLSLALVVSMAWAWVETFYRGVPVNAQLSFMANDQPYMPPPTTGEAVLGVHHFGDLELPRAYGANIRDGQSPYLGEYPTQYPPFSEALFVPLSYPPLGVATAIYLALGAVLFLVPLWLLLEPVAAVFRIVFLVPVAVLTTPFVSMIDRGNNIAIAAGLITWALWAWRRERWAWCGVLLTLAIGLKAYPIAL